MQPVNCSLHQGGRHECARAPVQLAARPAHAQPAPSGRITVAGASAPWHRCSSRRDGRRERSRAPARPRRH
eukprot:15463643-Alexandrium_andersonii.AAC.1